MEKRREMSGQLVHLTELMNGDVSWYIGWINHKVLLYSRNSCNIVNQLYFHKKKSKKNSGATVQIQIRSEVDRKTGPWAPEDCIVSPHVLLYVLIWPRGQESKDHGVSMAPVMPDHPVC